MDPATLIFVEEPVLGAQCFTLWKISNVGPTHPPEARDFCEPFWGCYSPPLKGLRLEDPEKLPKKELLFF